MIQSFLPTKSENASVLILGSMPSIVSLEKQEYYGFKQNRFWKIIETYFDCKFYSYDEKLKCLKKNGIVLWDVIGCCERKGSLDSNIHDVVCNDIPKFIEENQTIKKILCNGKKSYTLYMKYFNMINIDVVCMPSTSNANQSIKEEELIYKWFEALRKKED